MNQNLIVSIEQALATVQHFANLGFWPATALVEQLEWCLRRARRETLEPSPFPLCMAALMHQQHLNRDSYCVLTHQLRDIEQEMERFEMQSLEYVALCA
ncbi:hypothetical protein FEM03_18475 [Phragmitibacter flavus]|uniref:Uncharacterized protein n=1 Tax=Phragmitibacter flavus TaxID=2576071 RepID=A0A5R8KAM1_9BACT|nr:hypothetical protein [Phragmitibacter flavus]TLD69354.1 hypothetical protein FEM03_18475 [Phragmitibacter flavus]